MKKMLSTTAGLLLAVALLAPALHAQGGSPLYAQPDANDIVTLPPAGSQFDGEFADAQRPVRIIIIHWNFPRPFPGPLPDEVVFASSFRFEIYGQNELDGLQSVVDLDADTLAWSTPQQPGTDRRVIDTEIRAVQSQALNHPDFERFEIVGGSNAGFQSPGTTVLTRQTDGSFRVEASFNVSYQVRLVGRDGTAWEGVDEVIDASAVMVAGPEKVSNGII